MTTNPKSRCCGADAIYDTPADMRVICSKCGNRFEPQDQPASRLDEICSMCNWTNVNCLNLGNFGNPKWMCHGCIKTLHQSLTKANEELVELRLANALWSATFQKYESWAANKVRYVRVSEIVKEYKQVKSAIAAQEKMK